MANAYKKLKRFLRVIPAKRDLKYGLIPIDNKIYQKLSIGIRKNGEFLDNEKFLIGSGPNELFYLLWEPSLKEFPRPTLKQFLNAQARYSFQRREKDERRI